MAMVKIKGTDMGLWTNVYILFYIQGELDLIVSKAHLKRTFRYLAMDTRNGNRTQNHVKATVLTNIQTKEYRYETYICNTRLHVLLMQRIHINKFSIDSYITQFYNNRIRAQSTLDFRF